eukprot:Gb_38711 [translate_table: standard]
MRDDTNLYSELQHEIIWLQGEIAKLADDNPYKPALNAIYVADITSGQGDNFQSDYIHKTIPLGPLMATNHVFHDVSEDEVQHMRVEDLPSVYKECRDYIHGTDVSARQGGHHTDYVDSAYDIEHGQASQTFLESSIITAYERVGGVGPSIEFEGPRVDLTFDFTQRWPR